jgi:hypothetical protein
MSATDDPRPGAKASHAAEPKRAVPADALSGAEFDRLIAFVATARDDPDAPAPDEGTVDAVEPVGMSRRWKILVNCLIAVALGVGIGLVAASLAGRPDRAVGVGEAAATRALPTAAGAPESTRPSPPAPPTSGPAASDVNNPRIAPTITGLAVGQGTVVLRWRDATRSEATFIVIRILQGRGQPVDTLAPGTTEVVLDDLQPPEGPYCFLVIAVVGKDRGVSATRCAS